MDAKCIIGQQAWKKVWYNHLSVFEVVEAASGLFRSGQLFGSHLITLLSLGLLLALLAGLNAVKPAWPPCLTSCIQSMPQQ